MLSHRKRNKNLVIFNYRKGLSPRWSGPPQGNPGVPGGPRDGPPARFRGRGGFGPPPGMFRGGRGGPPPLFRGGPPPRGPPGKYINIIEINEVSEEVRKLASTSPFVIISFCTIKTFIIIIIIIKRFPICFWLNYLLFYL